MIIRVFAVALIIAGLIAPSATPAAEFAFGPRASFGYSKDDSPRSEAWSLAVPVWGGGLQAELPLGPNAFAGAELGFEQAGFASPFAGSATKGTWMEDMVAESLLAGWRWSSPGGVLHPRVSAGFQFTQTLSQRSIFEGGGAIPGAYYTYPDDFHRYRSFGLLGLGLGFGQQDSLIVDLRASQELWAQSGSSPI